MGIRVCANLEIFHSVGTADESIVVEMSVTKQSLSIKNIPNKKSHLFFAFSGSTLKAATTSYKKKRIMIVSTIQFHAPYMYKFSWVKYLWFIPATKLTTASTKLEQ